jgi:hypothetical protein
MDMKTYLLLFLLLAFICSCGVKKGSDERIATPFSLDTVLVDSNDRLIMAAANMFLSGFSEDLSTLYHYDLKNSEIEVIDLNSLELKEKLKVDRDGPNGVGTVFWFGVPIDSVFVFYNFSRIDFLDINRSIKTSHNISKSPFIGEIIQKGQRLHNSFCFLGSADKLMVPVMSWEHDLLSIALIDFENQAASLIDHPEILQVNDHKMMIRNGRNFQALIENLFFLPKNGSVYISNSANNDIFEYQTESGKLEKLSIISDRLPKGKSKSYRMDTDSQDQYEAHAQEMFDEISFKPVLFDPKTEKYYRIAQKRIQRGNKNAPGKYESYLIQYNRSFDLEAETTINQLTGKVEEYFVKDGKIWIWTNLDDELGFIRIVLD